jgi:CheY-like chemotaxis protein
MGHKLLLADDSVTIQRVIELTFADEDIQVIAVGDGQQAIARIDAERPDVVLADIGMPERDGYEVAAHVKGTPHLSHIPVVLLTGAFEPIDESRARAVGCDGVLVKPFEPQMVINRVRDLLAGRRPASLWATPSASTAPATASPIGLSTARPHDDATSGQVERAPTVSADARDSRTSGSLDDYFDRLDAAFLPGSGAPPSTRSDVPPSSGRPQPIVDLTSEFGSWDIGLDEQLRNASGAETPRSSAAAGGHDAPTNAASGVQSPPVEAPPLADAFAALLAAELGPASSPAGPVNVSEEAMEEIVRRVLARMTDDAVRAIVLDVAERLVREEIERIKNPQ